MKEEQKQYLIDIMQKDEELGLYNEPKQEIIIPKEEHKCTCKEHDPYCCQIHGTCPTCVKKETPKQETLEEVALIYSSKPRCFGTRMTFIDGAKWQEQQTIEEVFEWLTTNNYLTDLKETLIEQFKNQLQG